MTNLLQSGNNQVLQTQTHFILRTNYGSNLAPTTLYDLETDRLSRALTAAWVEIQEHTSPGPVELTRAHHHVLETGS